MNLIRYQPWAAARCLPREFEHFFSTTQERSSPSRWVPAVDIRERDDAFVLTVDLPGLDPKDIDITAENGQLLLRGERVSEHPDDHDGYRRTERYVGKFERRFELPDTADASAIGARSSHGVLTITIPKKPQLQPRRIDVDVA